MRKFFRDTLVLWLIALVVAVGVAWPQGPGVPGSGGGSGTVATCSTTNALAVYTASTTTGCGNADFTYATDTLTMGASGLVNFSAGGNNSFILPSNTSVPTTIAAMQVNSTNHGQVGVGTGGGQIFLAWAGANGQGATTCTNGLLIGAVSSVLGPTCTQISFSSTKQKAETQAADANVLTLAPAAAAQTMRVCYDASVSAATSGVISFTLSYSDASGVAQTNVAQSMFQSGVAAPNTSFTVSAAGDFGNCTMVDIDGSGTSIVVKWVGGGITTAKVSASIERII